mgnify:CR=1 FL=1
MNNTSLADSYLKLSGLDSALSKLASDCATVQLQRLGANSLKNSLDIFQSSLSAISQLASDITVTPELQKALDSLVSSIGSTTSQSLASVISNALLDFSNSSNACFSDSEDFVTLNEPEIKEFTVPETIAVPIGNKRIRISTNILIAIIGSVLLPLFFHLTDTIISLQQSAAETKLEQQRLEIEQERNDLIHERNELYKQCYDLFQSLDSSQSSQSEAIESWKESLPPIDLCPEEFDSTPDSTR